MESSTVIVDMVFDGSQTVGDSKKTIGRPGRMSIVGGIKRQQ